ncbi:MAG TPA: type II secretion system F family protein [Candidatus Dorea intestinavium]|nr:type II secretion system F family protein [Candidatus Dorea intestinavium]
MKDQNTKTLSNTEVSAFCSQMSMILNAGISATEGLFILQDSSTSPSERSILEQISNKLNETGSLYEGLKSTAVFPEYMLEMVHIAEQTGNMDSVFGALSIHYNREAMVSQSVKNAITYPMVMVVMMVIVILVLITKVMPIFNQVFRQLGSEMTGISRVLLDIGQGINKYSAILIAIVIVLIGIGFFFSFTQAGRKNFANFASRLPLIRGLMEKVAMSRFASGMYLTLKSGLTPEECLDMVSNLSNHHGFQKKLELCKEQIKAGDDLPTALANSGIFTSIYAKMASIGSKTGDLDEALNKIAIQSNEETDERFASVISTIEPTLVIVLSVVVGLILLSVMLPLIGILSSI